MVDIGGDMEENRLEESCQKLNDYCQNKEQDAECKEKVSGSRQGSKEKLQEGQTKLCQKFG